MGRSHHRTITLAALSLAAIAAPSTALAQQSIQIDLTGLKLQNGLNQSKTSAPNSLLPATRYHYVVDANVKGSSGAFAILYPNPTPLAQIMESLEPGSSGILDGYICNEAGTHPVTLIDDHFEGEGSFGPINATISMDLKAGINASSHAFFEISNVSISPAALVGSATITSGTLTVTRIECTADFDGDDFLGIDDFIAFQTAFALGDESVDVNCDGVMSIDDFIYFQTLFALGC